ncbi:hydroxyacylglutathione hydrolase [Denitratisoma sp. agr-D3]
MTGVAVEIIRLHAFTDNYIWALRQGNDLAVVDPGEAEPVLAYLAQSGTRLRAILLTHHHDDHVGGTAALCARGDVAVYGPAGEDIPWVIRPLVGGETITLPGFHGDAELTTLAVPGHTRGHVAYYRPGAVFCGDTLFTLGCGRLFEGTPSQMWQSLNRLAALPPQTLVYCAHEYTHLNLPFALAVEPGNAALQARAKALKEKIAAGIPTVPDTLAAELASNVFLRCDQAEVIAAAKARDGAGNAQSPLEVFTALRAWRNTYLPPSI